jgi:hypothetical protein
MGSVACLLFIMEGKTLEHKLSKTALSRKMTLPVLKSLDIKHLVLETHFVLNSSDNQQ